MSNAFTTYSTTTRNELINEATIIYEGNSLEVKAKWDTGATNSCISDEVVKILKMKHDGFATIHTPSGNSDRKTYLVDISLPNNVTIPQLTVIDSAIGAQNIGLLVGMDIINRGDFAVSNVNNQTVFTFRIPSEKKTDYVQDIRIANLIGSKHGKGKRKHK